jgi:hypothetical protein
VRGFCKNWVRRVVNVSFLAKESRYGIGYFQYLSKCSFFFSFFEGKVSALLSKSEEYKCLPFGS